MEKTVHQDHPLLIKDHVSHWKTVSYTKEDWCNVFRNKTLKFRKGKNIRTETPYWEHLSETVEMTLEEFFKLSSEASDSWYYFDYKYIKDVFPEFTHELKWSEVGLSNFHGEESALWIGNQGAHTPCHQDSYGCNVVAQLFGRKLWILIPPEESESLEAVRVPYEESSVYSQLNFYTPNNKILGIKRSYKVILSPGDVLYVPRHWWHYVENLEPAISANIWVPMEEDHESRLEESIVQYYISNICMDLTEEEAHQILNPNEWSLLSQPPSLTLIEKCLENYKNSSRTENSKKNIDLDYAFIKKGVKVEEISMKSYLEEKSKILKMSCIESKSSSSSTRIMLVKSLINSYCRRSNIESTKKALLGVGYI